MGICIVSAMLISSTNCCKGNSEWLKLEEKKDGLDVYKYVHSNVDFAYNKSMGVNNFSFRCPLCNERLTMESDKEICDLKNKGPQAITDLKEDYVNLVYNRDRIDIFKQLEEIANKIEDYSNQYDENRFYKYKCDKKNKEIYLIIFQYSKEDFYKTIENKYKVSDERYEISKWKNDESLKKTLLKERENDRIKYQQEQRMKQLKEKIENARREIREKWEEITFEKEYNIYVGQKSYVDEQVSIGRMGNNENFCFGSVSDLSYIANNCISHYKYVAGKKKIIQYISNFASDDTQKNWFLSRYNFTMSPEERKEYEEFSNLNMPKIKIVVDPSLA